MTGYESQTCCRWNPGLTSNLGQHCHTHNMCPCATMDSISAGKFSFEIYATLRLTSAVYKLSRASNSERVPDPLPAAQSCVAGHTRLLHPVYPNGASRGVCLILYTTQWHCVCEHAYGKTQPRGIILRLRGAYIRLDCAIHRPRHIRRPCTCTAGQLVPGDLPGTAICVAGMPVRFGVSTRVEETAREGRQARR